MLKQIPGIRVRSLLNQDEDHPTAALDSSLMALKMADLGRDARESNASIDVSPLQGKTVARKVGATAVKGVPVEVIRGVHRETIRY